MLRRGASQRVRIDGAGRVVIPVDVRKALARAHRKDAGSVVDAFLTARRAEAASET